jgi:hypothetical protein
MGRQRDQELARRHQQLLVRSAELRVALAHQARVLQTPLALADQARAGLHWLRAHPQWPLGALLLLAVTRPRRALRWASRLWMGWDFYKNMRGMFRKAAPAPHAGQTEATAPTGRP